MDKAFNRIHGAGAKLNDSSMKDPITSTSRDIKKKCPEINENVIKYFTKMKYHALIRALNEQDKIDIIADSKRKDLERNGKPRPAKVMRDFIKRWSFFSYLELRTF